MNIILCGLPLSGKSYYSEMLSRILGWELIDTDKLIESKFQKEKKNRLSCREISHQYGESYFRQLENEVIQSMKGLDKAIIAIGGGAVCEKNNVTHLKKMGKLIYLEIELSVVLGRLQELKDKPAYLQGNDPAKSYEAMAQTRIPLYENYSDGKVSTKGLNDMEVLAGIIRHIM
jgi:shikimate kinase